MFLFSNFFVSSLIMKLLSTSTYFGTFEFEGPVKVTKAFIFSESSSWFLTQEENKKHMENKNLISAAIIKTPLRKILSTLRIFLSGVMSPYFSYRKMNML